MLAGPLFGLGNELAAADASAAVAVAKAKDASEVYELAGLIGTDVAANRLAGGIMDLEGQVNIATSSPREWKRWGRYYCRSLASAHRNGTCHNFKDQSVQYYFGSFARDL